VTGRRLLGIYVVDHLAAATAGVALARRAARNNAANETGAFLRRLAEEIEDDREALRRIVTSCGFEESKLKDAAAWAAEKIGRLKLNGQLRGYSPLSRVLELEALSVGIAGKLALWRALQRVPEAEGLDHLELQRLAERAEQQRAEVEEHRLSAASAAFADQA